MAKERLAVRGKEARFWATPVEFCPPKLHGAGRAYEDRRSRQPLVWRIMVRILPAIVYRRPFFARPENQTSLEPRAPRCSWQPRRTSSKKFRAWARWSSRCRTRSEWRGSSCSIWRVFKDDAYTWALLDDLPRIVAPKGPKSIWLSFSSFSQSASMRALIAGCASRPTTLHRF